MSKKDLPNWEGHQPATSAALLDVITTAATNSREISRSDRVLFTACEFWASARNGSLLAQLADDSSAQLRAAEVAFTVIGLTRTAGIVHHARQELADQTMPVPLALVVHNLEAALAASDEPVDRMIAEFANARERPDIP